MLRQSLLKVLQGVHSSINFQYCKVQVVVGANELCCKGLVVTLDRYLNLFSAANNVLIGEDVAITTNDKATAFAVCFPARSLEWIGTKEETEEGIGWRYVVPAYFSCTHYIDHSRRCGFSYIRKSVWAGYVCRERNIRRDC